MDKLHKEIISLVYALFINIPVLIDSLSESIKIRLDNLHLCLFCYYYHYLHEKIY